MIINFQTGNAGNMQPENLHTDKKQIAGMRTFATGKSQNVYGAGFQRGGGLSNNTLIREKEKGKSLTDLKQEAENTNVALQQDYMTVMSNTMSDEDYAKLEEEGFHFKSMEPGEAVTIVDKIKAELASSGTVIAGYNDDLAVETLAEAVGSETLAQAVAESFDRADLPLSKENVSDVKQAWNMASLLTEPTDGCLSFMIDQELQPEIWDFYLAQNSGTLDGTKEVQSYFRETADGYLTQETFGSTDNMQDQMDRVIEAAGFEVNKESRDSAAWLLDRGLALTPQNLKRLDEIRSCAFPVTEEVFAKAAAAAVAAGKSPEQADLSKSVNIYDKAKEILDYYSEDAGFVQSGDLLTVRRQLEEVRFRMTAEVNVQLLKSGFSIDTAPMEELIEALKKAEAEVAGNYFPKDEKAVEKYHTMNETNNVMSQLPALPADLIGTYSVRRDELSLEEFHREGVTLRDTYVRANESYEALMTAPRQDLGDNIRKAFANIDDIIQDLDLPLNDETRRAVRILGYNRMEITAENVEKVSVADAEVQTVMKKMTPAMTLKMIRDGINPLEKSFEELNAYLDQEKESFEQQADSYSRFLYRLENKNKITESERESYIGIYRLLRQIEKSDGAAVGALINEQAEVHFSNLLTSVRSRKFKGLDVRIEDAYGAVTEVARSQKTISEQILTAFVGRMDEILEEVSEEPEAIKEYRATELEEIRQLSDLENDVTALLQKGEVSANAENLLAAQALLHGEETLFSSFAKNIHKSGKKEGIKKFEEIPEEKEELDEEYGEMLDHMEQEVKEAAFLADNSVDVKQLSLIHKQISIVRQISDSQEYFIPMYVGDRISQVHLTLEHSDAGKGRVDITLDLEEGSLVEAHFTLNNGRLDGIFIGNSDTEVTKLKEAADIISNRIAEGVQGLEKVKAGNMSVVRTSYTAAQRQGTDARPNKADGAEYAELYRIAKVFLQSVGN